MVQSPRMNSEEENNEEIIYEDDKGVELIKKLRTKLRACENEKKDYLDGWQRAQADAINTKKQHVEALKTAQKRAVSDFLYDLLPAFDSFDIALSSASWSDLDEKWRIGIESVRTQLLASLTTVGIEQYGEKGDTFDPKLHEAIGHESGGVENTIARVERRGYKTKDTVIRAAQVVVYN